MVLILFVEFFIFKKITSLKSINDFTPQHLFKNWNPHTSAFSILKYFSFLLFSYLGVAYAFMKFPFSPYAFRLYDGAIYPEYYLGGGVIITSLLLGWLTFSGMGTKWELKSAHISNIFRKISRLCFIGVFLTFSYYLTLLLFFGFTID